MAIIICSMQIAKLLPKGGCEVVREGTGGIG